MKRMMTGLCCKATISMMCFTSLQAETTEVILSNSMKCTKEELMTSFPPQIVQSVLKNHLPENKKDQAEAIALELSQKDVEVDKIVKEKASKLDSNPFKNLSQRDLAVKIYSETLYEIFAKVLKLHGITNEDQIQDLLEQVRTERSKLFLECIRKQHPSSSLSSP